MAIDIAPRPQSQKVTSAWVNILYYFFTILLLISVIGSGILFFAIKITQGNIQETKEAIAAKETPENLELERRILLAQKKIDDFANLMSLHRINSRFFTELESLTHPAIVFSEADLQIHQGKVSLSGISKDFEILGQQFLIFRDKEYIKNVSLSDASVSEDGNLEFKADVLFNSNEFRF